jgi:hypothetical protein
MGGERGMYLFTRANKNKARRDNYSIEQNLDRKA